MMFSRLKCLTTVPVCVLCLLTTMGVSIDFSRNSRSCANRIDSGSATATRAETKEANPFETVPDREPPGLPLPNPLKPSWKLQRPLRTSRTRQRAQNIIEGIEFRGSRRVPQETLRALIFTKKGDKYDEETLQRDFMALWNTGRFDESAWSARPARTAAGSSASSSPSAGLFVRSSTTASRASPSRKSSTVSRSARSDFRGAAVRSQQGPARG